MNRSSGDRFSGNFTQQEAIPEKAIAAAVEVMKSGRLHRYNVSSAGELSETARLELEFAAYQQQSYCLACASGGYALQLSLRAWGVAAGEPVLTNAFTLSPVPGAINAVGGQVILVETTDDLVIDLDHLESQIKASGARVLLLSHMRGHIVDMDAMTGLLSKYAVTLIEDCAHTMGASFNNVKSGTHGVMACFSTQTYKHINSGEGGLITSNNELLMAKAIILSGSYMLYERHASAPSESVFKQIKLQTPNCSGRMDNLRAAILRPQLEQLDQNAKRWNQRYDAFASALMENRQSINLPRRHKLAYEVPSSIQFSIPRFNASQNDQFLANCAQRGVELKWFGDSLPKAYTSRYDSWKYLQTETMHRTDKVLERLYDCRIPLTFSVEDCKQLGQLIAEEESTIL